MEEENKELKKNKKNRIFIIEIVIIALFLAFGSGFILRDNLEKEDKKEDKNKIEEKETNKEEENKEQEENNQDNTNNEENNTQEDDPLIGKNIEFFENNRREGDDDRGMIKNENREIVGVYFDNGSKIAFLGKDNKFNKVIDLGDYRIYYYNLGAGEDRYLFEGKYIYFQEKSNSGFYDKQGLYNIENQSVSVPAQYQEIAYLGNGEFAAKKDGKYAIINENGPISKYDYSFIIKTEKYYIKGLNNEDFVIEERTKEAKKTNLKGHNLNTFTYYLCCGSENPISVYDFGDKLLIYDFKGFGIDNYYYLWDGKDYKKTDISELRIVDNYYLVKNGFNDNNTFYLYDKKFNEVYNLGNDKDIFTKTTRIVDFNGTLILKDSNNNDLYPDK